MGLYHHSNLFCIKFEEEDGDTILAYMVQIKYRCGIYTFKTLDCETPFILIIVHVVKYTHISRTL